MNAQSKNLTRLAAALMLAMACGAGYAVDNAVTIEGTGTGNNTNLDVGGSGADIRIRQVGSGDGSGATESNYVGEDSSNELSFTTSGTKSVRIGQGAYYSGPTDATSGTAAVAVKGNSVKGAISAGSVEVSQTSGGNKVNFAGTGISGGGTVSIHQGYRNAAGGGGSGYTANVTQTGTGTITLNQGNGASDISTGGEAHIVQAGTTVMTISQGDTVARSSGKIYTNTAGAGTLNITKTNTGNLYVNGDATGTDNATAATIGTGTTSNLVSSMTGTLHVKNAKGEVDANVTGGGTVTINSNGTGASNKVYVNSLGNAANAAPLTVSGALTIAQNGNDNSTVAVKGGVDVSGQVDISQSGNYQVATFNSVNGSSGTYTLTQSGTGTGGNASNINVDF